MVTDISNVTAATQQDAIYARLREWLMVGRFVPGQRLKIRTLATDMGAGQMPVRAALQRLAAEGALVNVPNAGVTVPRLSVPELDDLLTTRLLLEGTAAEQGCLRLDAAALARMQTLEAQMAHALAQVMTLQRQAPALPKQPAQDTPAPEMNKALVDAAVAAYLQANEDFHVLLYRACGSPLLFELIQTVWLKAGPISNQLFDTPEAATVLNEAHGDLLRALQKRDAAAVRRAVERDLFVAGQFLRQRCGGGA